MSGTGRVGVGVVGAGSISDEYLTNLTNFPDLDVRFVADLDTDRARAQADAHGVAAAGTLEELLADDEIEIVVNLTIPAVHVEVGCQIAEAGKHVWSEKPYALDRASAERLRSTAEAAGTRVAVAPDTFLGAGLQTALRHITDGDIGRPLSALVIMQSPGPESWHPSPEFLFAEGAGPLFDFGPYYLTTLVQVFGPVARVSATASQARAERTIGSGPKAGTVFPVEVPTHVSALLEFADGGSAQLLLSFDSHLARSGLFEVAGERGTIVFPDPNTFDGEVVIHTVDPEPRVVAAAGHDASRGTGVVELARALRAGREERAPGSLALHVLDAMVSILDAAQSHTGIEVTSTASRSALLPEGWNPREATLS